MFNSAKENPYDTLKQFTVDATDYNGVSWSCGWTSIDLKGDPSIGWPLTGKLNTLMTMAEGLWVSDKSSVELVFHPKLSIPMDEQMVTITKIGSDEIQRAWGYGQHILNILDTEIKFFYRPSDKSLWVTANTSQKLPHPHLENWVGEVFTILLGQIVHPRLVARNHGDDKAQVWLRPSPKRSNDMGFASLLGKDLFFAKQDFWSLYSRLLMVISQAKDENGRLNFEAHPLTRFYQEIIQATHGSIWVISMTLSSAAEGIVKLILYDQKNPKVTNYLKALVIQGTLKSENEKVWTRVRNAVMHGNLVSPWTTEEDDKQIYNLMELVRQLTLKYIEKELGEIVP